MKVQLLCLPAWYANEFHDSNRMPPTPGDRGTCVDTEPAGMILRQDAMAVVFEEGPAKGDRIWLPAYLFRTLG